MQGMQGKTPVSLWLQASFLGLAAPNPATALTKAASQHGNNTRSYIFGCDASNSAPCPDEPATAGRPAAVRLLCLLCVLGITCSSFYKKYIIAKQCVPCLLIICSGAPSRSQLTFRCQKKPCMQAST